MKIKNCEKHFKRKLKLAYSMKIKLKNTLGKVCGRLNSIYLTRISHKRSWMVRFYISQIDIQTTSSQLVIYLNFLHPRHYPLVLQSRHLCYLRSVKKWSTSAKSVVSGQAPKTFPLMASFFAFLYDIFNRYFCNWQ